MKYIKFIFLLFIILTSQITLAQVATTYSVMTKYIQSGIAGGDCDTSETGEEEYTGFLASNDFVNTTWVSTGCQTIDVNGIGTYAQNIPLQTRTNNSYNISFSMDAWEDDYGDRCTWETGPSNWLGLPNWDDCRSEMELTYNFRDTPPSNGTYTDTPIFNAAEHQFQMQTTWKYSLNGGSSYTPSCNAITTLGWYGASQTFPDQGTIFSYLLDLTQGISYNFTTCGLSSEDTIIRVYGADGYTVIASNDDSCTLQSNLDFTPTSSGKYVVEVSRYVSSNNTHGPLLVEGAVKITISGGGAPQPQVSFEPQYCHGASTIITATNAGNFQVNWYSGTYTPNGNNNNLVFTGNPFITPPLSSQNNYVVEFANTNNCVNSSTLEIWVSPLPIPVINNVSSVCYGNSVVLSSSTPTGTIYWYDDAYNLLGSGNAIYSPPITQNTVFYARVESLGCFGNYTSIMVNVIGTQLDPTITQNGDLLTSNQDNSTYQWISECNSEYSYIQNETNQSYTPTAVGNYGVLITDTNTGCVTRSECITISTLGLNNQIYNPFQIYPNPTNGIITISFNEYEGSNLNFNVTDIQGRIVKSLTNVNEKSISFDLSTESSGVYFIRIYNETINEVQKIIKY